MALIDRYILDIILKLNDGKIIKLLIIFIYSSKEAVNTAKLNLSYTKVYTVVDGYVSNINFKIGSQASTNKPILALVDEHSYRVFVSTASVMILKNEQ